MYINLNMLNSMAKNSENFYSHSQLLKTKKIILVLLESE